MLTFCTLAELELRLWLLQAFLYTAGLRRTVRCQLVCTRKGLMQDQFLPSVAGVFAVVVPVHTV